MKYILILFLLFPCHVNLAGLASDKSQDDGNVRLQQYMTETYGLTTEQFERYCSIAKRFDERNDALKSRNVSSKTFKTSQRRLYDDFYNQVKTTFDSVQFFKWSTCIERLDRYRVLSESYFVGRNKIRALYNVESEWSRQRKELWESSLEESEKHRKNEEMQNALQEKIQQILGDDIAGIYMRSKTICLQALSNMDVYSVSFNDASHIAEIEMEYKSRRQLINADKSLKRSEVEIEMERNWDDLISSISSDMPADIFTRWYAVNSNKIDYTLKKKYGLNPSQIVKFKNEYNAYVLAEYSILSSRTISNSEKVAKINSANDDFCGKVRELFSSDAYSRWLGRRQYELNRRLSQKGLR